jgi:hypothetical protein
MWSVGRSAFEKNEVTRPAVRPPNCTKAWAMSGDVLTVPMPAALTEPNGAPELRVIS